MIPKIIEGNRIFDNRGSVQFNNDLKFQKIKRFYVVHNYSKNFVRAWHGHLKEEKYISCTKGTFQISAVQLDNIKKPGKKNKIFSFIVNENDNKFVHIPKGYANGTMSFEDNSKLLIFSTSDLNESINDDYRYESTYWDPWIIHER
tara:strand:- start:580 stop:1017 length:438 start_codon:yes stop_codon:yes gene_type:complete